MRILEEGGFNEEDPQEGEREIADSSADSSPGGSRICLPLLKVRQGTRSPASRKVAKKERTRFPCVLECHKKFATLKHYMSKAHKMTREDARRLVNGRPRLSRNKEGRYRRLCSVPGCQSKTVRIADHIRRYYPHLSTLERCEACYMSKRIGGDSGLTPVSKQPPEVADTLSPVSPCRSSPRLAQPS